MKRLALLLLVVAGCAHQENSLIDIHLFGAQRCGVERWAVKTLTDSDARRVNLKPRASTIVALRQLSAPRRLPAARRISPTELQTYSLEATLVGWKLEADRDFHLVLRDSAGRTMIAEVPDTACVGVSRVRAAIAAARRAVVHQLGQPSATSFRNVDAAVSITGVAFFDVPHGQRGVAPNAIELHPVTAISFR